MSNKVRGMPREVVNVLRMNVLHRVPVLWLCLALLLLALVPSVPAHAGFVGCVLAKRSGDEAVQLKLTTDQDGEVTITIGDNVITFGVRAGEQLDTGLLEISGELVVLELFSDGRLTDKCTICVWDIPYHYEKFCCDEIPPVIEAAKQPKPNAKGWNNELVTVSMTAEDEEGGSGIAAIYYIVTGAVIRIGEDALGFAEAGRIATYSFDLAEDGTYELEFWAEDNAGNESEHGTLTVEIDKTPPLIEASRSPSPTEHGWNNTSVTVSFQCADSLSGIASCTGPQQITHEGKEQSVSGVAIDRAGNRVDTTVGNINVDKTPPMIEASRSPSPNEHDWNNTAVTVSFHCSDSLSGIASCTGPQQITREGKGQSVAGVAVDKAGNRAETGVENINIDKTDPNVSVRLSSSSITKGETIRLTIEASDSGSGIAYVMADDSSSGRISLGREGDRWTGSLQPSQDGQITIRVTDGADNVTTRSVSYTVTVTVSAPLRIAFTSKRDGNYEIYVMNADGSGQTNLTNNLAGDRCPAWSPDGKRIAFDSARGDNWEVYVMNADGSGQTRLTNNSADDHRPAWSPDGKRIAFSSDRDGNWEIYVMNADGSSQTRLTNNLDSDWDPAWSPQ